MKVQKIRQYREKLYTERNNFFKRYMFCTSVSVYLYYILVYYYLKMRKDFFLICNFPFLLACLSIHFLVILYLFFNLINRFSLLLTNWLDVYKVIEFFYFWWICKVQIRYYLSVCETIFWISFIKRVPTKSSIVTQILKILIKLRISSS